MRYFKQLVPAFSSNHAILNTTLMFALFKVLSENKIRDNIQPQNVMLYS